MAIIKTKDFLARLPISVGDFVTPNDDSDYVQLYILTDISNNVATIAYLDFTYERDDVVLSEMKMDLDKLIFIDESFATVGGALWQAREAVVSNKTARILDTIYF